MFNGRTEMSNEPILENVHSSSLVGFRENRSFKRSFAALNPGAHFSSRNRNVRFGIIFDRFSISSIMLF